MQQVTAWFANKRNRTGNTRSRRKRQTLENGVLTLCEMLFRQQNPVAAAAGYGVPFTAPSVSATSTAVPLSTSALSLLTFAADRLQAPLDTLCSQPVTQHHYLNNNHLTGTFPVPPPGAPGSTGFPFPFPFPFNSVPFPLTAAAAQGQQLSAQPFWQNAFN